MAVLRVAAVLAEGPIISSMMGRVFPFSIARRGRFLDPPVVAAAVEEVVISCSAACQRFIISVSWGFSIVWKEAWWAQPSQSKEVVA